MNFNANLCGLDLSKKSQQINQPESKAHGNKFSVVYAVMRRTKKYFAVAKKIERKFRSIVTGSIDTISLTKSNMKQKESK